MKHWQGFFFCWYLFVWDQAVEETGSVALYRWWPLSLRIKVLDLVHKCVLTDRFSIHCNTSYLKQRLLYSRKLIVKIYNSVWSWERQHFCWLIMKPQSIIKNINVDFVRLGCDAMSLHDWFMTFQRHYVPSKRQELCYPVTWHYIPEDWIPEPHHCENCRFAEKFFFNDVFIQSYNVDIYLEALPVIGLG